MHKERCKADEAKGRLSETWTIGTRLAPSDVEGRARAKVHGLEGAARDAESYEARCLLMPDEEAERVVKAARKGRWHCKRAFSGPAIGRQGGGRMRVASGHGMAGSGSAMDRGTRRRDMGEATHGPTSP